MAKVIADAFVKDIESLNIANENSFYHRITLSAGYASFPDSGAKNYMQLINFADAALYRAKSNGRNRSCENESIKDI